MKIGIVSPYRYPYPGGVTEHVNNTYLNLRKLGHDVRIITPFYGKEAEVAGDVIRVGRGYAVPANGSVGMITVSLHLEGQVKAILRYENFDVLHFHEPFVPFLPLQILKHSTSLNVATFHAFGGFSLSYFLFRPVLRPYFHKLDGHIAVSGAARHFAKRYFPGEYKIIPNGVDSERFDRALPLEEFKDGKLNLLFAGRMEERKGLKYLLKAYARVKSEHPEIRLIVLGAGNAQPFKSFVKEHRLPDVVFTGFVSQEIKPRYFASADIFCAPSTGQESFGIVLLEAMAAGKPIVATDIHGYKNILSRNKEGFLVPPKEDKEMAVALSRLVDDADLRAQMGAAGKIKVQHYTWEKVTRRIVDYYGELLARSGRLTLPKEEVLA